MFGSNIYILKIQLQEFLENWTYFFLTPHQMTL